MDSHLNPACVGCGFAIPFRKEFVSLDSKDGLIGAPWVPRDSNRDSYNPF